MNTNSYQKRKKYQRHINKIVRNANKHLKDDWLWNGRFYIHQIDYNFEPFEDKSGALFSVVLMCDDKKTNQSYIGIFDNYDIGFRFYAWINDCIVKKFSVWDEKPNPYEQAELEGRKMI